MREKNLHSFEDLEVWKSARELRVFVSNIVKTFPQEEKYKLTDQSLRSSRGITNQIAEGFGRFHYQENIQYCRQARGSLFEILDHMIIAKDEKYISDETLTEFRKNYEKTLKLLNGYISYLNKAKRKQITQ